MVISGFSSFLPKIIENQFRQTAGTAAIAAGESWFEKSIDGVAAALTPNERSQFTSQVLPSRQRCSKLATKAKFTKN